VPHFRAGVAEDSDPPVPVNGRRGEGAPRMADADVEREDRIRKHVLTM